MIVNRDDFDVLMRAKKCKGSCKGRPVTMTGVEPIFDDDEDGEEDEDGKNGEGDNEGDNEGDAKSGAKKGKKGKSDKDDSEDFDLEPVYDGDSIGEVMDQETSRKIQEAEGYDIKEPIKKDDVEKAVWDNVDKLKDPDRTNTSTKTAGGGGDGNLKTAIHKLYEPVIDWRKVLKKYIGNMFSGRESYMGNKKHLHKGIWIEGSRNKYDAIGKAIIAIDVSGSVIGGWEQFVSEAVDICMVKKLKKVHILPFADSVHDEQVITAQEIRSGEARSKFESVKRGGGTEAIWDVIKRTDEIGKFTFIVIITDGYLTNGLPEPPKWAKNKCIWLVYDHPSFAKKAKDMYGDRWGKVIIAENEETQKKRR